MDREEIEKEVDALLIGKDKLPADARMSFIALLQARNRVKIDQCCPYRKGPLEAELF